MGRLLSLGWLQLVIKAQHHFQVKLGRSLLLLDVQDLAMSCMLILSLRQNMNMKLS